MAESASGAQLSGGPFRRAAREDPRRGKREEQGGIASDGTKDALGIWIEQSEAAKFWLKVMNERAMQRRRWAVAALMVALLIGLGPLYVRSTKFSIDDSRAGALWVAGFV